MSQPLQITALSGGVGGARFLRGLTTHLAASADPVLAGAEVTVVANTGDDITLHGLRVQPDVDSILYTLGEGVHEEQGWGRAGETTHVQDELEALGAGGTWFTLGDKDFATHILRSQMLGQGASLSEVVARLAQRWGLPDRRVRLLPMSDTPVETHVVLEEGGESRAVHFQEWWVRLRAAVPASRFVVAGLDRAVAAPGVLDAIRGADIVLLPPSNPVVSIGIILGVPGVRDALRGTAAPVVAVSPLIGGRPVRGHLDACMATIGVECSASGVASLYADFLDGWLVDPKDADTRARGVQVRAHTGPLLMTGAAGEAEIAGAALALALELRS